MQGSIYEAYRAAAEQGLASGELFVDRILFIHPS